MTPPIQRPRGALELAEIVEHHGHRLDALSPEERRILRAIASCRTAALGGHVEQCDHCHHQRIAYNSCRNRHCPRCQGSACARWMADRAKELLNVEYFHVVFTLPDTFNSLVLSNKRVIYNLLFDAVAQTLLQVAANPKHLGARIGFLAILHTWGQNLALHPHLHCVIPGGGLSPDGKWIACRAGFFLPVRILSRVFRGKFLDSLKRARIAGELHGLENDGAFARLIDMSVKHDWVVYAKPPFGSPRQVLKYLARYTHRIAISNRRLISMDDSERHVPLEKITLTTTARAMTLDGERVPPPLPHARRPARLHAHPPLRFARQPRPCDEPGTLSATDCNSTPDDSPRCHTSASPVSDLSARTSDPGIESITVATELARSTAA